MIDRIKMKTAHQATSFLNYWSNQAKGRPEGVHSSVRLQMNVTVFDGVKIGRYSYINGPTFLVSGELGAFCSVAWSVSIGPHEHPARGVVSSHPFWYDPSLGFRGTEEGEIWIDPSCPPIIGNDVWIGANVIILRGSVIEDGAVIAAGSIVKGHVPAYSIFAGNPAKLKGYRLDEQSIKAIRDSRWWEWDDAKLRKYRKQFQDPDQFIASLQNV